MIKINCQQAEEIMENVFKGKAVFQDFKVLEKHCKKCDVCKAKYYTFQKTDVDTESEGFKNAVKKNKKVDKSRKRRIIIISLISIILILSILIISAVVIIKQGRMTAFASVDYGVSETFNTSNDEHPYFGEVQEAMSLCKDYFSVVGKGTILLSLKYNDKYSYNKEMGFEDTIIIDFSYYRVFYTKGSSGKTGFVRDDLSFVVKKSSRTGYWSVRQFTQI